MTPRNIPSLYSLPGLTRQLAEGAAPPHMTAALRGLLDRFGNQGSSWGLGGLAGNRSPEAKTPLPDGARFEEHTYANQAGSGR